MADGAGKKSGASGFLPGLVLGVIVGAATAFVALEVLDSPKIDVDPNPSAAGAHSDRDGDRLIDDAQRGAEELIEQGEEAVDEIGDEIGDAIEGTADDAEDALKNIDPPAVPSDG